jgi:peptidoglycan pentaglycine glycine transferase (the first glycine)
MDLQRFKAENAAEWDRLLTSQLDGHLLQSWQWGEFKECHGWNAERLLWRDRQGQSLAAAQILERRLGAHFVVLYCPRGPAVHWADEDVVSQVISDLMQISRARGAIFLKIDPAVEIDSSQNRAESTPSDSIGTSVSRNLEGNGWRASSEQIQFRNTMLLDLHLREEQILAGMKPKTRYNIRLASRHGVHVRLGTGEDLELLYKMYAETSLRDGFAIREPAYYFDVWGTLFQKGMAQVFVAEVEGMPTAGLILFRFGKTAYYMYGMSKASHREKMPNYLLQWEAIRWAKNAHCNAYDFWGAPDRQDPQDPMWGVYRFKAGFGARLVQTIGAWDYPARPVLYWLYHAVLPRVLSFMRLRGRAQTRMTLD